MTGKNNAIRFCRFGGLSPVKQVHYDVRYFGCIESIVDNFHIEIGELDKTAAQNMKRSHCVTFSTSKH